MLDDDARAKIATSYLSHILIAVDANDRSAPFRDFLDNWYAYENAGGHLTSGGRPVWFNNPCARRHQRALSDMHFVSREAGAILASARDEAGRYADLRNGKDATIRLMVDHAIPLRVLRHMLFDDPALRSIDALRAFLQAHYRLGVLTFDENARLNSLGLVSAMPSDWNGRDVFARYAVAGITA